MSIAYGDNELEERIILLLIKSGVDVNERDDAGDTALVGAIQSGTSNLVRNLLMQGANPYIRNNEGQNAFEVAKKHNTPEVQKLLAEYEKTQSPEHIAALQAVAQMSMQSIKPSSTAGLRDPARIVQQYLRRDYRGEALQHENKEKEEKDNKERSSLAPMVDER